MFSPVLFVNGCEKMAYCLHTTTNITNIKSNAMFFVNKRHLYYMEEEDFKKKLSDTLS